MQLDQIVRIVAIIVGLLVVGWILAPFWNKKRSEQKLPNPLNQSTDNPLDAAPNSFPTSLPFTSPFPSKTVGVEFQKGIHFVNGRNYEAAITEFSVFIDTNINHPNPYLEMAYLHRAFAFQANKQFDKALADYDSAIGINPSSVQGYMRRADFKHYCLDDDHGALNDIEAALKIDAEQLNAYLIRGVVRAKLKQDDVFEDFDQAFRLARHKNHAPIYVQRGQAYYALNDLTAALKDFREAIRLGSDQTDYCLCMMAKIFREKGDFKQALTVHDERMRFDPKNPRIYMTRGYVRHQSGDIEGAIADYEKVMELNPKYAGAYNNRAWVYVTQGKYDEAFGDCEKAINRDSNYEYSFGTRGTIYFLQGKYDDAISDFNRAIALKADHKFAILGQALTLCQMGQLEAAKGRWKALVEIDPTYATIENLRDEVLAPTVFLEILESLKSKLQALGE